MPRTHSWLKKVGMEKHTESFVASDVDGSLLFDLDEDMLRVCAATILSVPHWPCTDHNPHLFSVRPHYRPI